MKPTVWVPPRDEPTRSPGTQKPLQDIQDLIDKLAAVTQQLRHPGSMTGPSN